MTWHLTLQQHTWQFGFALTTHYIDTNKLPATLVCNECGADVPQVVVDLTVLIWTVALVAHKDEEQQQ